MTSCLRDWSLITGSWGGGGGASEVVTPTKIGRGVKVLAMLMGGGGHIKF